MEEIFTFQGLAATVIGAGETIFLYLIANALSGMFPAWHVIIWAVAGIFGLQALILLAFGLFLLYVGVSE